MVNASGNWLRASEAWEIPTPRAAERPTMVVFRAVRSWEAMSFMPVMAMVENTVTVAPPSTHWGMVVSSAANLGDTPASSRNAAGHGEHRPVHHLVGGDDAHVLGVGSRGQAAHQRRQDVAGAVGDDTALELLVSGIPVQAAHGGGGEVADGLDGVDGKQQSDGNAGGGIKASRRSAVGSGQGEPGSVAHVGKAHHAEGTAATA